MATLAIAIQSDGLQVVPGSAGTFTVEVRNLGSVVDRYRCEIIGLDPAWWTVTPASLELFPQREGSDERSRADAPPSVGRFTVTIRPPRSSAALAGTWGIGAKVSSEHEQTNRIVEETSVTFLPFGQLEADLRPAVVSGRFGASSYVRLANRGNRPELLTVTGSDRSERIDFQIARPRLELQPGGTASVRIRLTSGSPKLVGGSDTKPFAIDVRADNPDTAPVAISGTHEKKAIVPSGLPAAIAVLAALGMGAAGLVLAFGPGKGPVANVTSPSPATPSIIVITPAPTAPPTAAASVAQSVSPSVTPLCPPSAVDKKYDSLGGPASFLGQAKGCDIVLGDGGRFRDFEHGSIYALPGATEATQAFALQDGVRDHWRSQGATTSVFGYPSTDTLPDANGDGGWSAHFQGPTRIWWTPSVGAASCTTEAACNPIIIITKTLPPIFLQNP